MKKTFYKSRVIKALVVLLIPIMYYFTAAFYKTTAIGRTTSGVSTVNQFIPTGRDFVNCIFNLGYYGVFSPAGWNIYKHMVYQKDSLNFNTIHLYGTEGGSFDAPLSQYEAGINNFMDSVHTTGLRGYYGREKIEKLCYSQRLVYEAEGGNNGFSYQNRLVTPTSDSGRTVLDACPDCPPTSSASAGWLCYNIKENLQHSDLLDFQEGDRSNWHIKPVMRINKSDFDNPAKRDLPVVKINTVNFQGDTINSVILRVWNFRQGNNYDGQYIEKFTFEFGFDSLRVSGRYDTVNGLSYGYSNDKSQCKVDFRIYWFGQVRVWLDKVVVDDDRANILLNPDPQISNQYTNKIIEEVNAFTSHPSNYTFYADEMSYSNISSVKRVQQIMKQTNSNAKLSCALTNYFNYKGFKHYDENLAHRIFLDSIQPERITCDAHEIFGPAYLPQNEAVPFSLK